jgi:hypothetical protein
MRFHITVSCVALVLWPIALLADAPPPDPADAKASVPASRYDSVFGSYLAYQEQQPGRWREHNDEMDRVGGHAGHLKDSAPASEAPVSSVPSTPKGMSDHSGHHKK